MFELPPGVAVSQKISCVSFLSSVSLYILNTFPTQALTLELGSSGKSGSTSLWSNAKFLPSFVTTSILSTLGSTEPDFILSALSPKLLI